MADLHHCFLTFAFFFMVMVQCPASAENLPAQNWRQRLLSAKKDPTPLESTVTCRRGKGSSALIGSAESSFILVACADRSVEIPSQSSTENVPIHIPPLRELLSPKVFDQISQVRT
jgi:hypothetical protein